MGNAIASAEPITVTATAAHFPEILEERDSAEIPADMASRNVVVTVEKTMMTSPAMPRPARTMICAMSVVPA
jgi:hypothetical protein